MTQLETRLLDFGLSLPHPVNFKEPDTGRYIFSNTQSANQVGVASPEQMLGLTVRDLNFSRSETDWGRALAAKIERMDRMAEQDTVKVEDTALFLKPNGRLIFESVTKIPILGGQNRVIGIATINQDLTYRLTHRLLYEQYTHLCGKKQAPRMLLQHLGLETWFCAFPTYTELKILLDRAIGYSDKVIAHRHKVSTRTVETHLINLRSKLRGDTLPQMIESLRHPQHLIDAL
jgi:hypothetical protein